MSSGEVAPGKPTAHKASGARIVAYCFVALAAGALIVANRSDVPLTISAIGHARLGFIALALVLVLVALLNQAAFHAAAQRAAGLDTRPADVLAPAAAAGFMNLVAKSGGMAGLAPLLAASQRRNRSRGSTLAAYLLVNVLGHLAFAFMLGLSIVMLAVDGRFTTIDAVAVTIFTVLTSAQMMLVIAAARNRTRIRRLYAIPARVRARFTSRRRRPVDAPPQIDHQAADELYDAVQLLRRQPKRTLPALGHAVLVEVLGIAQLWCVLQAVGIHPRLSVPVLAYAVSVLFTIVGFVPGGLGFVEVGLGTLLVSFGFVGSTAAAAVVLYRLCELWIPFGIGAMAAHSLSRGQP